jgi:NADH-quinone oxidoreductase subunit N
MFGMFVADTTTAFLNLVVLLTAFIAILLSVDYLKRAKMEKGEFYSLVLFSASGAMFMVSANDLVLIFIALELLSIPLYVMAAFRYPTRDVQPSSPLYHVGIRSEESGMKYFILGAFASAFLVYGSALIYGGFGSTNLNRIFEAVSILLQGEATQAISPLLLLMGASLLLVGLGFKVAVFPFHMWTPDVYEGAPTNVTAYMSVVAKVGDSQHWHG